MIAQELDCVHVLRHTTLFQDLDDAQLGQVATAARERRFNAGEHIFHQNEQSDDVYILVGGQVCIYLSSAKGDYLTFRMVAAGDVFGEFAPLDAKARSASAEAMCDSTVLVIGRDDFHHLMRMYYSVAQRVMQTLVERLRFTTTFAQQLAFLNVTGRVASVLVQMATQVTRETTTMRVVITQDQLARTINARREWVNRALHTLANGPHPSIRTERGAVVVLDCDRLRQLAETCERRGQERAQK